ncbi:MAG: P-loop NTPase fold protein [Aliiglaciecola sp.]|uniref:KAP family P-loop NTPase fold protein n=1 Tax=Aliiglaciecola sp. TaxID=1872441 RepID=UPI00329A35EF
MQAEYETVETKGGSQEPSQEKVDGLESDSEETSHKSTFPKVRFLASIAVMLVGIVLCVGISILSPLNPTPLITPFNIFSAQSWYYPIERNAALRLNIVDTPAELSAYQVNERQLSLQFDDGSLLYLPYKNTQPAKGDSQQSKLPNLAQNFTLPISYEGASEQLLSEVIALLSEVVQADIEIQTINIFGYISPNQPLTNDDLDRLRQSPRSAKAEPPKQQKIAYNADYAQQQSIELAQTVGEFITSYFGISSSLIEVTGYGFQRHYTDDWQEGSGPNSGVFVTITPATPELQWTPLPSSKDEPVTISSVQNEDETWVIYNSDIIVFNDENGQQFTEVILPSALFRTFAIDPQMQSNTNWMTEIKAREHQVFPSPLALLVLAMSIFMALRMLVANHGEKDVEIIKSQQLIDSFVSDSPANDLTQDKLGFIEISSALSRFLRNAGTKAPLTLAITGVWGSGKSSLMYFLKQNLESFRLHPVWVNAWHHQNEEQFLAGLLSAIQTNAIPPFWTAAGLLYRWNLLKMRWTEAPMFFFSVTVIFLCSLGYIVTSGEASFKPLSNLSAEAIPYLGAVFGAFSILRGGMDRISGLVNTNVLKTLLRSPGSNLDLRANVGLREKFAKEFNLLCNALGDSTLTIFIDDLDRCKEQRIMDVMETINYLVSSGDCYIIVGMERAPIENAICSYYQGTHEELDQDALKTMAKRYLEKIINIEIPVPIANSGQFDGLVKGQKQESSSSILPWLKPLLLLMIFILSLVLGSYLASVLNSEMSGSPQSESPVLKDAYENVSTGTETQDSNTPASGTTEQDRQGVQDRQQIQPKASKILDYAVFESNQYYIQALMPVVILAFIALLIRVERFRQRKRIVENDSDEFLKTVSIWAKALGLSHRTPRNIKRYVNRARYLAMRNYESGAGIQEDNLVTLAAILEFAGDNQEQESNLLKVDIPKIGDETFNSEIESLQNQSENIDPQKRQTFLHWVRGVNVN